MKKLLDFTLILVRHAHRDKNMGSDADNGLSAKGKTQAEAIARYFKKRFGHADPVLYSSPKLRCQETLTPLAKLTEMKIQTVGSLNESSSSAAIAQRVAEFERLIHAAGEPLIVACSHGDWLPFFIKTQIGADLDLAKGAWAELQYESGVPRLTWLLQDFSWL